MIQISEQKFLDAVSLLKADRQFISFCQRCQKRLDAYKAKATITYDKPNSKVIRTQQKKKSTKLATYNFGVNSYYYRYLDMMSPVLDLALLAPSVVENHRQQIDKLYMPTDTRIVKQFFQDIEDILNYNFLRKYIVPKFYNYLGLKTCIYCNAQHTIFLKKSQKGRYQADHNIPKSDYPCFSITLSNLYPSCNNCNHSKSNHPLTFKLYYSNIAQKVEFKAYVEPSDIAKYLSGPDFNEDVLNIRFKDLPADFKKAICLEEIYDSHKDYVADLIHKQIMYNDTHKKQLLEFERLFPKPSGSAIVGKDILDRLIYGSYLDEERIHKRVFSKLNRDLLDQLNDLAKKAKS